MKKFFTLFLLLLLTVGLNTFAQVPTNGLVGCYPFSGNADDESINANNGIIVGATLASDRNGVANNSFLFDGIDDYIKIAGALPITNSFSISFWAYCENVSGYNNIISDGSSNAGGADFLINFKDNSIGIRADKNANLNYEDYSPTELQNLDLLNKWVHVVWVMNPSSSKIYLNSNLIATINESGTNEDYHDDFSFIGARQVWGSPDYFFKGKIDDILIYDRVLNDTEIQSVYNNEIANVGVEITINVQNVTVNQGQSLEVPISVTDLAATDNIISYQFDIEYDNTVLTYSGNSILGTLAAGGTVEVNTTVAGKLSVSYMNSTAIVGTGDILKLQFNTLKADTTDILISNAYLNATPITALINGIEIIKDITQPTARISYNDSDIRYADNLLITATFSEPMLASKLVYIKLTGSATYKNSLMTRVSDTVYTYTYLIPKVGGLVTVGLSNGTDLWGNVIIATPTSGGSFTMVAIRYGDVDDDGKILAYDAALTLQYSVGLDPLPTIDPLPWENWRDSTANVDKTGIVTANDAGMILRYSAGIITSFNTHGKKSSYSGFADVSVEVVDNDIIFYSSGDLLGLNISTTNENKILGNPVLLADNFLSAFNISGFNFRIGMCTANSPSEGLALVKIPYIKTGSVTFNMNINTEQKTVTIDLVTGIVEVSNNINIYPNPVKDILIVSGLNSPTTARIYNTNGKLMQTVNLSVDISEINVSDFPTGVYVLKLQTNKEIVVKRFAIK